jgi:cytochrome P450
MANTLTADDPRYGEMFDVMKETAAHTGGVVHGDLTPLMNRLRERAPVLKGALRELLQLPETHHNYSGHRQHYTLLSYKVCESAFRDNQLFSSAIYKDSPGVQSLGHTILEMVGDEHRRYRSVVQPMFLRPKVASWWRENWIDESVNTLLDRLVGRDAGDLNMDLCARLPMHVVTRGIGMNGEAALTFRDHLLRGAALHVSPQERATSQAEVARMLRELIAERRAQRGDDVVSGLIHNDFKEADGSSRKLGDEEIFGYCRLIMLAGGGTTWRQLGITIYALLSNYEFWEACRDDRSLIENAVNESLRWCPTDPTFPRLVTQDTVVAGVPIAAGCRVDICLGAANRDPERWSDPDRYDPFRPAQTHLGFSTGPHQCLGMNVAKLEMIAALNGLMDRFPKMRLDPDAPPPQLMGGLEQRGMTAVPVRFK